VIFYEALSEEMIAFIDNVGDEYAGIEANLPIDNLNGHTPNIPQIH
jgi:hypothetical protein